jgi:hypothetical protein
MTEQSALTLGLTISTHICLALRYVIQSPQSVHFRGGCCYIINCVDALEDALAIGSIPLAAAGLSRRAATYPGSVVARGLPSQLPVRGNDYNVEEEDMHGSGAAAAPSRRKRVDQSRADSRAAAREKRLSAPTEYIAPPPMDIEEGLNHAHMLHHSGSIATAAATTTATPVAAIAVMQAHETMIGDEGKIIKNPSMSDSDGRLRQPFLLALSSSASISKTRLLLEKMRGLLNPLVYALSKDFRRNFEDIETAMATMLPMCSSEDIRGVALGDGELLFFTTMLYGTRATPQLRSGPICYCDSLLDYCLDQYRTHCVGSSMRYTMPYLMSYNV